MRPRIGSGVHRADGPDAAVGRAAMRGRRPAGSDAYCVAEPDATARFARLNRVKLVVR